MDGDVDLLEIGSIIKSSSLTVDRLSGTLTGCFSFCFVSMVFDSKLATIYSTIVWVEKIFDLICFFFVSRIHTLG